MRRALLATLALLLLLIGNVAIADVPVPRLTARVTDQTGTLDASQSQSLESTLAAFEKDKGSQIAILIVPTTGDETIEQYSIRVTDAWKLGRKGVDDGVLLLVAKDDHKVRIEVGKGLEGTIPDAIANRIIDEQIVPRFKQGDYAGGLQAGVARMIGLVNGEPLPQPSQHEGGRSSESNGAFGAAFFAFMVARALFQGLRSGIRGLLVGGVVGLVAAIAGASMLFAGGLAVLGFFIALVSNAGSGFYVGGGGWGGGSSGGGWGGGGFSGGGGGFSGGGASGGW
ncbi:MAG TPA: YgcG family protein [Xanthomonadaceae bacterium]|jgi:uncharacterized protein